MSKVVFYVTKCVIAAVDVIFAIKDACIKLLRLVLKTRQPCQ